MASRAPAHARAATLVAVGVLTTAAKQWQQRMDVRHQRRTALRRLMAAAGSYEQWREVAEQLYALEEADLPAGDVSTRKAARLYDRKLLLDKTAHLRRVRATGHVKEIMLALRTDLIRNIANIAKRRGRGACPLRLVVGAGGRLRSAIVVEPQPSTGRSASHGGRWGLLLMCPRHCCACGANTLVVKARLGSWALGAARAWRSTLRAHTHTIPFIIPWYDAHVCERRDDSRLRPLCADPSSLVPLGRAWPRTHTHRVYPCTLLARRCPPPLRAAQPAARALCGGTR